MMGTLQRRRIRPPCRDQGHAEVMAVQSSLALALKLVSPRGALALSLEELGDIQLPSPISSIADQASLRGVGPLYLASELEKARLLPVIEMFSGLVMSGGITADIGVAETKIAQFWRQRRERFSPEERRGFFSRLFGQGDGPALASERGANEEFENLMIDLAGALYKLDESPLLSDQSGIGLQTRIRMAASALVSNLAPRSHGMVSMAARDVVLTTQVAIDILKEPAVQRSVGATSVWQAIQNIAQRYLNEEPDIDTHLTRGKSGLLLLAWLVEIMPNLDAPGGRLLATGDSAVEAASAWLEASLSLHEREPEPAASNRAGT